MTYHFILDEKSLNKIKFCPICGNELLSIYLGDYTGFTECLECNEDENGIEFIILEEYRDRFPKEWDKKFTRNVNPLNQKEFGKYFAHIRKKSGFKSQRQLASTSGINNGTIARIEDGSQKVKPETLKRLSKHLNGVTYEDLMKTVGY